MAETKSKVVAQPRCEGCGAFLAPICDGTEYTCSNARCERSWQACEQAFHGSMLGAAARQAFPDVVVPDRVEISEDNGCVNCMAAAHA